MTTRRPFFPISIFALAALIASACGGSVDASNDDAGALDASDDAQVECVLVEGACPEGCVDLTGSPVDTERGCTLEKEVIGCAPRDGGSPDAIGCYVELESGTVYWTPNLYYGLSGFRECSEGEMNWEYEKPCRLLGPG